MSENYLRIINGDCRKVLRELPDCSVQCCVTSPPYLGLRDYGHPDQIGQEKTPDEFVKTMVEVFRDVRRVLKDDGTLWLNLGDCYSGSGCGGNPADSVHQKQSTNRGSDQIARSKRRGRGDSFVPGLPAKNLIGIPWRVALALQADGWFLRSDIIWSKKNCMPESVTDRPGRSHEHIFLLSKSPKYFYDADAIKEPCIYKVDGTGTAARKSRSEGNKPAPNAERNGIRPGGRKNSVNFDGKNAGQEKQRGHSRRHDGFNDRWDGMKKEQQCAGMRNKRDVWTVATSSYSGAHFATFPPDLIKPCILAGSRLGDAVLDPFGGSGTTARAALEFGRRAILIELNPEYLPLIEQRTRVSIGLL